MNTFFKPYVNKDTKSCVLVYEIPQGKIPLTEFQKELSRLTGGSYALFTNTEFPNALVNCETQDIVYFVEPGVFIVLEWIQSTRKFGADWVDSSDFHENYETIEDFS